MFQLSEPQLKVTANKFWKSDFHRHDTFHVYQWQITLILQVIKNESIGNFAFTKKYKLNDAEIF